MSKYRVCGAVAVVALLSAVAVNQTVAAGITNSKHDFSSGSTGPVKATTETQICRFCHLPHGAISGQPLLWSHQASAATAYAGWGSTTTYRGTTLPTTGGITASSARCFACHDGTVAVGAITSFGTNTSIAVSGAGEVDVNGKITNTSFLINPVSMAGNHPVAIPYPGSTYNGITSAASSTAYSAVTTTGCTSGSGKCTTGPTTGAAINILGTAGAYGIECTSCHSPHDNTNSRFLVTSNVGSALCLGCHSI